MINKKIFKIFLIILIPIIMIWLFLVTNTLSKERDFLIKSTINENRINDHNTSVLIDKYLSEILENLKIVRDSDEISNYANNGTILNYQEATGLLTRIMKNKINYDQIRYIDTNGQELIRIQNKNGLLSVVAKDKLQNKKDYYYFKETINLKHNQIYISPLDLNIENNELEVPHKPMLRFSTPIFNDKKILKGILIINYKAQYFLNLIRTHEKHSGMLSENLYVLNKNGQFIINSKNEINFSFMYKNFKDLVFKDKAIWTEINKTNSGNIKKSEKFYTFYDLLSTSRQTIPEYSQKWLILHEINMGSLFSFNNMFEAFTRTKHLSIFAILLFLSYILAYYIEKLREKNNELNITMKIADFSNDAIMITDGNKKITYVNSAYQKLTGYSPNEVIGLKPTNLKSKKYTTLFYKKMQKELLETLKWNGLIWGRRKDGLLYPEKLKIIAVKNKLGIHHYIAIFSDLSSNKRKREFSGTLNYKNGQIILPNENMMIELLKKSVEIPQANFMVICISIENFNDLFPFFEQLDEDISDIFIKLVSPLICKNDYVAQTGRNLFTLVVCLNTIQVTSEEFIKNLYEELTKITILNESDIFFKIKIGVSFFERTDKNVKQLALNSMIALDWAKKKDNTNIAFYENNMTKELNKENEIESNLKTAISDNEFFLVYQPQINIKSGKIIGMEALLRWNSAKLGIVPPMVFIPIAEKNNLIIEIGNWVTNQVCKDLESLNKTHPEEIKNLRCAINFSAMQLVDNDFVEKLLSIINKYDVRYNQLEMEITESLLLDDLQRNMLVLKEINKLGINIALDDFGTGYSSFSYLHNLPIDKIKIDRSFIKEYPEADKGTLVKLLVDMSKKLNKTVLIEGAETLEQIDFLKAIGSDYIQGYYYSKPVSKEDFIKYLQKINGKPKKE